MLKKTERKKGMIMVAFLQWTAWEMQKPARYGAFHILMTLGLLIVAILVARWLRNSDERKNRIVMGVVGGFLLLTEVYKIAFHMTVNPYDWHFWGAFPFQLCSVPMYLCLFCAFCRKRKVSRWLYEYMFAVNMFGGIMAFLEPSGIQHGYVTLTLHAYIWHMLLIFVGLYLYMSKRACTDNSGYKKAALTYLISCVVAQGFNLIFGDKINCFYISPYKQSPLAVFKNIYDSCGWLVNMVLMIIAMLLASAIVYYTGWWIRSRSLKKTTV